jgi:hypothetical protein
MLMLIQTRIIAEPPPAKDHPYLDLTALSPVLRCELQSEKSVDSHKFLGSIPSSLEPPPHQIKH